MIASGTRALIKDTHAEDIFRGVNFDDIFRDVGFGFRRFRRFNLSTCSSGEEGKDADLLEDKTYATTWISP